MSNVLQALEGSRPGMPDLAFHCPGCKCMHAVWTKQSSENNARWQWNGDMVKPTFSPSLLLRYTKHMTDEEYDRYMKGETITPQKIVCHSFVKDGNIQFLSDCTHELAGQTVALPLVD